MNNRFVFVMPAYNAEATIQQSLLSVIAQSNRNWKIIIRDDMSTDNTVALATSFRDVFGLNGKIDIQVNTEKKWEVRNVLEMISQCDDDDIICRLDADDWLTDLDALAILHYRYAVENFDAVWTAHRWAYGNQNISGPLPNETNVYIHPWVSSHFKTFRKKLINDIDDRNFRNQDGEYFKRIGDQAIYLPVLNKARRRLFEPIVAYHYTIDESPATFQTDDAKFQKHEAEFLRDRQLVQSSMYGKIERGKFVDLQQQVDDNEIKISFIYYRCFTPNRGVVHMRAVTPAYFLSKFTNVDVFCEQTPNSKLSAGDIAVFVKQVNEEEFIRAKEKKCITVFDPVDNFFDLSIKDFDVVIACNKIHATWLAQQFVNSKIVIIDHLHTNISKFRRTRDISSVASVKYVGCNDAISQQASSALNLHSQNVGYTWNTVNSDEISPNSIQKQYEKIDIGVVFVDESITDDETYGLTAAQTRMLLKPSNKLTCFMSFGIPVVFNFHESYRNILERHPRMQELCVKNIDEMLQKVEQLVNNKQYYQDMSDVCYSAADDYHMNNVYDMYIKQIKNLGIEK